MSIANGIVNRISNIEPGVLFTYKDFDLASNNMEAVAATFSRLTAKGVIKRFEKGKYYKPEQSVFGELKPSESESLKYFFENPEDGYVSGLTLYNQWALTTQVPNLFVIATNNVRRRTKKGNLNIAFIKAYNTITKENVPFLQLLDVIKGIKEIPDRDTDGIIKYLKAKIKALSLAEQNEVVRLALNYPPAARALSGALLEDVGNSSASEVLYKSLNKLSKFNLYISKKSLSNIDKWKIK
jgi:hypothetical protein